MYTVMEHKITGWQVFQIAPEFQAILILRGQLKYVIYIYSLQPVNYEQVFTQYV